MESVEDQLRGREQEPQNVPRDAAEAPAEFWTERPGDSDAQMGSEQPWNSPLSDRPLSGNDEQDRSIHHDFRAHMTREGDGGIRNLPALLNESRLGAMLGWGGLLLFIALVSAGTVFFARDITDAWPASRKLYDSIGLDPERSLLGGAPLASEALPLEKRLKLTDLTPSQRFINGTLTLVINGKIQNISPNTENLPPIEVVLLDGKKLDLKTWVFQPPQRFLKAGASVAFETQLENPPPAAQDIRVTFVVSPSAIKPQHQKGKSS